MVYLIHLSEKLAHSQHYVGYSHYPDLSRRLEAHKSGQGSPMLRAAVLAGIKLTVAKIWPDGDRTWERWLKMQKHSNYWCPECRRLGIIERIRNSRNQPPWKQ